MSYVHQYAFDCLKIERTFTTDLPRALGSAWLISGISEVTKSMNALCIAEGIESMEQVDALRESGVTLGRASSSLHPRVKKSATIYCKGIALAPHPPSRHR